jgi:hypothetical protein
VEWDEGAVTGPGIVSDESQENKWKSSPCAKEVSFPTLDTWNRGQGMRSWEPASEHGVAPGRPGAQK